MFSSRLRAALLAAALSPLAFPATAETLDRAAVLDTFEHHPDFELSFVAHEPQVLDPVDLEFDQYGRPFVIEMPDYPYRETGGRVVLLEDTDEDGYYETRKVFAEDLNVADSLLPWNDGILVAAPPDLIYLKDTDGDDVADVREVLLSGFAVGNPQHNYNGLSHGIDNWIYGANGGNGGAIHWPDNPDEKIGLRFDDFRVDLKNKRFASVGRSSGGFEIAFDEVGRMFATHNLEPMSHLVFPGAYLENVPTPREGTLHQIVPDTENDLVRLFPIGEQATRVNHPEQSGYFSGACGITYYGGGAFPDGFNGNLFVCDVVVNLIQRRTLTPAGTTFTADRGRPGVEFLASTDRAFRPVNMTVAPDGSLWVLDMHRDVIEHPEWIPQELQEGLDLNAGKAQGRIFRIAPKSGPAYGKPDFPRDNLPKVAEALGHPNQWWRQTAQRLLVQWADPDYIDYVDILPASPNPLARIHSMWVLDALGDFPDISITLGLQDPDPRVRETALRIAAQRVKDTPRIHAQVAARAKDDDPRVRMYAALVLGLIEEPSDRTTEAVRTIAGQDLSDPFTRIALMPAIARQPAPIMHDLLAGELGTPDGRASLAGLIGELVGRQSEPDQVVTLVEDAAGSTAKAETLIALYAGLTEGLQRRSSDAGAVALPDTASAALAAQTEAASFELTAAAWDLMYTLGSAPTDAAARLADARRVVEDETADTAQRVAALRLLKHGDFDARRDLLLTLIDPQHAPELQRAAMGQLSDANSTDVAEALIERWRTMGPNVRTAASDILLYRRANHDLLLSAMEDGRIKLGEMNLHLERRRVLLRSSDKTVRERAKALFTDAGVVTRKEVLARMRPAITLEGDAEKGAAIFEERCAKCHQLGGVGASLGPNLTEIARKSRETILHDILDPNAAVDSQYVAFTVETTDFEVLTGIVEEETQEAVTLRDANNAVITIAKDNIDKMTSGGLSIMPENLEEGLAPQDLANLLEHLLTPR